MNKLVAFCLVVFSSAVIAAPNNYLDASKLTPQQRAEIQLKIEQTAAATAANPSNLAVTVREEASAWADLGKNVGTALVASAKEVGQGVNEFSQTPVGQVTTAIIVYKVIGQEILGLVFGVLTLVVGTVIAIYVYSSIGVQKQKFENVPRLWGLWVSRKVTEEYRDDDWMFGSMVIAAAILVLTWVTGLNLIF
jgi:hypothetical protein